jgi:diguanylate cyclase (GGDEF)-like protein/PAS domain S-box-containing protein
LLRLNLLDVEQDFDLTSARAAWRQVPVGQTSVLRGTHRRRDGSCFPVEIHFGVHETAAQRMYIAVARDLGPQLDAERLKREAEQAHLQADLNTMTRDFLTLLESTSDHIYFKDRDGRIRYCSPHLAQVTGRASWRDMVGLHDRDIFAPELAELYAAEEAAVLERGEPLIDKVNPYIDEHGQRGWISTCKWPVRDDHGAITGLVGISRVVTEQVQREAELHRAARTDFLTGLASRREFLHALDVEVARLRRDPSLQASVLMLDLDHFKRVNDEHGHAVGDGVLRHIAQLLAAQARKGDVVGRLGGEEFAILLPGCDLAEACAFAERVRARVDQTPQRVEPHPLHMTVSIGASAVLASDNPPEAALGRADTALYAAKHAGRNCVRSAH